jgi:hypothetical protein
MHPWEYRALMEQDPEEQDDPEFWDMDECGDENLTFLHDEALGALCSQ